MRLAPPALKEAVCDILDSSFRRTRTGKKFSPWAAPVTAATGANFNFDSLLLNAIVAEHDLADDDSEGQDLDYEINFDSPTPLSPLPDAYADASTSAPPPLDLDAQAACSHPTTSKDTPHTSRRPPTVKPFHPSNREYPDGEFEKGHRKNSHNRRRAQKRKRERESAPYGEYRLRPSVVNKYVRPAVAIETNLDTTKLPHTVNAYTGGRDTGALRKVYTLDELKKLGFKYEPWDGGDSRPITDDRGKVIGALCCPPEDADWHDGAAAAFDDARQRMRFPKKDSNHRRGTFCAQAVGSSFGGGQKMPGNLVNTAVNTAILASLLSNIYIIRIAGFASAAFATWAPNLYTYYVEHLRPLHTTYPRLKRNFINSVFAAATFNFGPVTCTYPHRDPGNLPFGWCAITALGKFDPTRGGHLVLWDMHLIIEFPPGTTILIPSATIRHSNVAIQKGETRFSFTQYTAGGLFRWVDQGFQPSSSFLAALSSEEVKEEKVRAKVQERWNMGVNLFSDLTSLQQPPNFDAV